MRRCCRVPLGRTAARIADSLFSSWLCVSNMEFAPRRSNLLSMPRKCGEGQPFATLSEPIDSHTETIFSGEGL